MVTTESDVDQFHDVLYTPDWVFVDAAGQRQAWPEVRRRALETLSEPQPDSMTQPIRKLSLVPDGAIAIVDLAIVRTVVDREGRYGRPGATHVLIETTSFRDQWVRVSDAWRLKSREQIGRRALRVDKPVS